MRSRNRIKLAALSVALTAAIAGCGSSAQAPIPASSKLVHVAGSPAGRILLTAQGAQHLGLQTATVSSAPGGSTTATVVVPFSAVIYAPSGQTYAFTNPAALTFEEVPITIDHIDGNSAFLSRGPQPGSRVVTVGAEELYGVQTGVLAQT
jgi:hypothetical protein